MRAVFTLIPVVTWAALAAAAGCGEAPICDDEAMRGQTAALYEEYQESFADAPEITADELLPLLDSAVIVDRREPAERAVSMLPNAITSEAFEANMEAYRDRTVVVYCTIGYRSGIFVTELVGGGFDAHNLVHGILGWSHIGAELVTPDGETTRQLHVYGEEWDLAGCGYETTW